MADGYFGANGAPREEGPGSGQDPSLIVPEEFFAEDRPELDDEQVRDGQPLPGEGSERNLELSSAEEKLLAKDLIEKLGLYDDAMQLRREREEEIERNYAMVAEESATGQVAESAQMASEMTMSLVDQATARLVENVMSVTPLMHVEPIAGPAQEDDVSEDLAESTERFLNNYAMREVNLQRILPVAVHRSAKVGTSVLYAKWKKTTERFFAHDREGRESEKTRKRGNVRLELIPNRHVIVWPATIIDWQRDYELVGHRAIYSRSRWKAIAADLDLDEETIERVESQAPESDDEGERIATFGDEIRTGDLVDEFEPVILTELWLHTILPGQTEVEKVQVILHEASQTLLWYDYNRLHSQKHPYFPIRYKISDDSAWGKGIGDETLFAHASDMAMRNLEIDNMMSGAYWAYLVTAGSSADHMTDRVMPGQKIPVDSKDDFVPTKMGGEVPELYTGMEQNNFRSREATGLAPVLGGQGDPTMKSGAGTGSTLALIEQAGKKFGQIDRNFRLDLSDLYMFILEMVAQYGTEGVWYRYANRDDAARVRMLKYTPPRGTVSEMFALWAQAPSASSSAEARKMNYLAVWKFAMEHLQMLEKYGVQVLQQENPAAIPRLMRQITETMTEIAKRIVELHDLPTVKDDLPELPEATEQDQIINQLSQQLQQAQQQMQQMQQMAAAAQGSPGGPAPPQGAPPPPAGGGMQ